MKTTFCLLGLIASWAVSTAVNAANIIWTNTAGGNWSVGANWNPNQVPGSSDTAILTNDGTYTVTMDVGATIAGLVVGATTGVNTQTLLASGQTLTLGGQVTVNLQGRFNFNNGTLAGAVGLAGTMNWAAGSLNQGSSLTIAANGVLNLTGTQAIYGPLTNNGTVNWQGGNLNMYYYPNYDYFGEIWNQAGAQWNIQCDQTMLAPSYSLPTFNNAGTLTKSGTGGTTTISALLNNSGPVQAQSGTILFNDGGNLAGNFQAGTGAAINFAGNLTLTGPTTISSLALSGATITGLSNLVGTASLSLTNCTINEAETITTTLNWSGGMLAAGCSLTVATNGVLNLTGNQSIYGPLTNNGTVNWQSGNLNAYYYPNNDYFGEVWNQAGAQWNIQCDQTLLDPNYSLPTFNNAGTLTKSGTSGTTTISAFFNNSGPVLAQSGTILFNEGGNLAGNFQTGPGAAINFAGNLAFTGPTTIANLGLSGATVSGLGYLVGAASLSLTNCTLPDAVTITTTLNWAGGTLSAGGSLTVATNGVLNLTGNPSIYGPLTNNGTVNWQGGNLNVGYYPGGGYFGEIWNQAGAQWNIQCDQTLSDPNWYLPTFNNAGTLTKSGTSGTTTINAFLNNSGPVQAQSGTLLFNQGSNLAGDFQTDTGAAINFAGNLTFTGPTTIANLGLSGATVSGLRYLVGAASLSLTNCTLPDAVTITTTLNWAGGTLSAGGSLTVATNGVLNLTGSPSIYGPLTNNGTVNWQGGNLNVDYYPGGGYFGEIWNQAGAQWNIQCDQTLYDPNYWLPTFNNAGTLTKSGTSGTTTISAFLNNSGPVQAQSGTLLFNQGSNLAGDFQTGAGAAINFSGNLTLTGPTTIPNLVDSGATVSGLSYLAGNASLTNCTIPDAVTITTILNWSGGTLGEGGSLTVATNAVLNLTGTQNIYGPLTNNGTVNWQGGNLNMYYYPGAGYFGELWNQAGAQWNIQCDQTLYDPNWGPPIFNNAGTLTKSGTSGATTISALLNNSGPVQAQSGTILFNAGGNLAGNFQTTNGTAINFAGNLALTGPTTMANLVDSGATVSGLSYLVGNASLTNCTIPDAVTITTTLNWSGGTLSAGASLTVATNAVLNLTGTQYINSPLTNNGTVNWQSGTLNVYYYPGAGYFGELWNQAGAQWNIQCDQTLYDPNWGPPIFNNAGTLTKSGTSGATTISALLNNSGPVQAQSGTILFNAGGNLAGNFQTTNGTAIDFAGNLTFTGPTTIANLMDSGATISGLSYLAGNASLTNCTIPDAVTITTTLNWSGGTLGIGGSLTVATNGALNLTGNQNINGALTNNGTVNWQSGTLNVYYYPGAGYFGELWNQTGAQWNIQCDQTLYDPNWGPPIFNNAGTVIKSNTSGTTTLSALLNNSGLLDSESGVISLNAGLEMTGGTLNFGLNSLTNYGRISLSGNPATLDGSLSAQLNNGYVPATGSSFPVLTFPSASGVFTNFYLPFAVAWQTNYDSTDLTLTVLNVRPSLAAVANQTMNELTTLSLTNSATDPDSDQTLTFSLVSAPGGMSIIPATGIINWTPAQTQSPATNTIAVQVADNGTPPLSATNTFTVIVKEVNVPPTLPTIATQIVNELTLLTVTNSATDFNIHSTITGYALAGAPSGMAISAGGIITWAPQQLNSPSTNWVTTIVTNSNPYDLVNPQLTATNTFALIVREVNVPPSLPTIATKVVNELGLLTVTNAATNANLHSIITGYALLNPLAGMSITAGGVFTWTPAQSQSPGTNLITTIVTNNNPFDLVHPQLTATNTFTVIVKEVNVAPALPTLATQLVNELTLLTVTNTATNSNIHSTITGYALVNPPSNLVVSATGIITWTPAQAQSPGTNLITTIVTNSNPYDLINPTLTTTNTFTVIVKEVNVAPTLPTVATKIVNELTLLTVTNTAENANIHSTVAGYLLVNPPSGMSISTSGIITWTPVQAQTPGTNLITTVVTNRNPYDLVNPQLTATNTFTVIVKEVNVAPTLPTVATQIVNELTLLAITNTATSSNIHSTITGYKLVNPPSGMVINASGVITWTPAQMQSPGTNLITTVVTNRNPYDLVNPQLTATNTFTVIVKEMNVAPTLPTVAAQIVNELTLLAVTNTAQNANIHSTVAGYLLVNPPSGMSISTKGIITWTPMQTQSPGTNLITTIVTNSNPYDLVNPQLNATNTFPVVVKELNQPPVLPVFETQAAALLQLLTLANTATEPNLHSTNAGYGLLSAPAGVAISTSGIITWTPATSQTLTTNLITTVATNGNPYDPVNPRLTATNDIWVIVQPSVAPTSVTAARLSRTNLSLTWPADHTGWRLQVQTNSVATGLGTNWVGVGGSSATNQIVVPQTKSPGEVFYRLVYP